MTRFAVFIDAGYLKKTLSEYSEDPFDIDVSKMVSLVTAMGSSITGKEILRVYWYDGSIPGSPAKDEHSSIAKCKNVKIRLGQLRKNPEGGWRQKGVDGLIVTDLISLSQNKAISDAILISGDEDLCVGVVPSQNMGIRVHLLNVQTKINAVSPHIVEDSDTQNFFDSSELLDCLLIRKKQDDDAIISEILGMLSVEEKEILKISKPWAVPKDINVKIMRQLGRHYTTIPEETKKYFRNKIIDSLNK